MFSRFLALRSRLLGDFDLSSEVQKVFKFMTCGDRDGGISLLLYGISDVSLDILEKHFGLKLSGFLKSDLLSRMNCIVVKKTSSKDVKIRLDFSERPLKDEEKTLMVEIFSSYGKYERSFVPRFFNDKICIPPLIIDNSSNDLVEMLMKGDRLIERTIVSGLIDKMIVEVQDFSLKDRPFLPLREVVVLFFDEEKEWLRDIMPINYQIHLLDSENDFTIKHFFNNIKMVSEEVAEQVGVAFDIVFDVLSSYSFFLIKDVEEIKEHCRALVELDIKCYPKKFEGVEGRFNRENLMKISALLMNIEDIWDLLESYAEKLQGLLGEETFLSICRIAGSKGRHVIDKLKDLNGKFKEFEEPIDLVKELNRARNTVKQIGRNFNDHNVIGKLKGCLLDVIHLKDKYFSLVEEQEVCEEFSRLENILEIVDEKLQESKKILSIVSLGGDKEDSNQIRNFMDEVYDLMSKLLLKFVLVKPTFFDFIRDSLDFVRASDDKIPPSIGKEVLAFVANEFLGPRENVEDRLHGEDEPSSEEGEG